MSPPGHRHICVPLWVRYLGRSDLMQVLNIDEAAPHVATAGVW